MRIVGLCVVGACAFCAVAASGASAALPELGRCVKVAVGTGGFAKSNCVAVSKKHNGEFEWEPGPGAQKGFKVLLSSVVLENTQGHRIICTSGQLTGEYTGVKSLKMTKVVGEGCEDITHHTSCYTNPNNPAVLESETPLVGELGDVPGSKTEANPWLGWDLKAESMLSSTMLSFACGEAKGFIAFMLEGSVIGRVTKTNLMQTGFALTYKQSAGVQALKSFIGGPEDVLTLGELPFGQTEVSKNPAALGGFGPMENEEPLEVKAKV
jgi:hypothetical protein